MTRRRPSRTSRSLLLSSSFFRWAAGIGRAAEALRDVRDEASRVSSRAVHSGSQSRDLALRVEPGSLVYLHPRRSISSISAPSPHVTRPTQTPTLSFGGVGVEDIRNGSSLKWGVVRSSPPSRLHDCTIKCHTFAQLITNSVRQSIDPSLCPNKLASNEISFLTICNRVCTFAYFRASVARHCFKLPHLSKPCIAIQGSDFALDLVHWSVHVIKIISPH